ncbi:hypothetical protein GX50_05764 [[Emmonsia] crescens]|uniref:Myb-like domain-containing protein n=1 Tax=[Emmonsia] crescens TaxID=73230 RepID=A0A2B7ZE50_9EURO|nr:hypothetical protein GX50_05764 [Emmonsia crescens]
MTSTRRTKSTGQRKDSSAISKSNGQNTKKPNLNRPKKRSIVRWNDTLDTKLLLSIQSACNALGIKLPWQEVAELMGSSISEGAIVQHLSKLRVRMEDSGQAVPPPLKRGGASAGIGLSVTGASANRTNRPKRSTVARQERNKMKLEGWSNDDDGDSSDSDDDSVAAAGSFKNKNKNNGNANDNDNEGADANANADAEVDKDNRSESGSEYIAAGASFLQFPNDASLALMPSYNHNYKVQAKDNTKDKAKTAAQSHATTSSSGDSPQQKVVKLRIRKGGRANCDGNGAVGDNGDGNVDALGRRLSGQNISSASSQTVHSSPAGTVDMDVGGTTQPMIHETGTIVEHLHQQRYHHGQSQYGWAGSNSGPPHVSPADILRRGGHVEYGNHGHNHMASVDFQQRADSFSMSPNGMGMLHSATANNNINRFPPSGYQENMHMHTFPNSNMPPPRRHNPPISAQGYSAGGMWHNTNSLHTHTHTHTHAPKAYHTNTNITHNPRPHHTPHDHDHEQDARMYRTSPTLPYQHNTDTEPRTIRGESENPSSTPTTLIEHAPTPDQQQQGKTQMADATLEDHAAIMNGLGQLSQLDQLDSFSDELANMEGGHVEDLFGAYGFEMDGPFNGY